MCQSRGRGLSGWGHRGRPEQHRPFLKGCQQGGVTTECHQHSPGTRSSGKHGAGSQNPPLEPPSPNIPRAQTPPGGATSKGLCSWSRRMVPWGPPQPPGMAASGAGSSRTPAGLQQGGSARFCLRRNVALAAGTLVSNLTFSQAYQDQTQAGLI